MEKYLSDYDNALMKAHEVFKQFLYNHGMGWRKNYRILTAVENTGSSLFSTKHSIEKKRENENIVQNIAMIVNNAILASIQFEKPFNGVELDMSADEAIMIYEERLKEATVVFKQSSSPDIFKLWDVGKYISCIEVIEVEINKLKSRFRSQEEIRIGEYKEIRGSFMTIINYGLCLLIMSK